MAWELLAAARKERKANDPIASLGPARVHGEHTTFCLYHGPPCITGRFTHRHGPDLRSARTTGRLTHHGEPARIMR